MLSIVYVTTDTVDQAQDLAHTVVSERLAAAGNVLGPVSSVFWWEGAVRQASEAALILKTRSELVPELIDRLQTLHSYLCPGILSWNIHSTTPDYQDWVQKETTPEES